MKFFSLFNDNSVAHYTALNNWMTVKWLGSGFRFCPGILLTWLGRTTNTSAKPVGIEADIRIQYIQNTCQMHYILSQLVQEEEEMRKREMWEMSKMSVTQTLTVSLTATFCQLVLL